MMKESKGFIFFDKDTNFNGVIDASQLILEGSVVGEAMASETVFLKHGSRFYGDIKTKKLLAEEGSTLEGNFRFASRTFAPKVNRVKPVPPEEKHKNEENPTAKDTDHIRVAQEDMHKNEEDITVKQMHPKPPEQNGNNNSQEPVTTDNFPDRLW